MKKDVVNMLSLGSFKIGDTFAYTAAITDKQGQPIIGASSKLKSQIRSISNKLYADLIVSETENSGTYLLKCTDTTKWIEGSLFMDIQYTDGDIVTSSDTIKIETVRDVTQNG